MNHNCKVCSNNGNCGCKICKRSIEKQVCLKCFLKIVERRKLIKKISQEINELLEMTNSFFHDYENFITVEKIMRTKNINFIELPRETKARIMSTEEFYEVKLAIGKREKIEIMERCMSIESIASSNQNIDDYLMLFNMEDEDEIFGMLGFEREYLGDISNFI
ncbi:unnamed protein product [Brachionus calyciflorus]|uniref:Uncharacterized protein n=1 Tax=Brachionus calyciflorus TaxID=104777 RepID=A0A814MMV2_9BILA|nr:unnamed protein product [Brachionus calyciflorus]